jgi:arylsulfatase A-like enzyme
MYPGLPEEQKHLYGCITAMDEQIGRLRDLLKKKGIEKNTILLFCSDNGPSGPLVRRDIASAGPLRGHKHQMWEGGLRVPSLMVWPGQLEENTTCAFPGGTVDYLPTVLDLAGLPPFEKNPLDGISLLPAIRGEMKERPLPLAFGYQRLYRDTELYAFIDGRYKICIPDAGEQMKLYDLAKDPAETKDISSSEPERFDKLKTALEAVKKSWLLSREGKDYAW